MIEYSVRNNSRVFKGNDREVICNNCMPDMSFCTEEIAYEMYDVSYFGFTYHCVTKSKMKKLQDNYYEICNQIFGYE